MDSKFWINAWNDGRTNFHQKDYNSSLLKFFPELKPKNGENVLVPLCGKSKDMIWLASLGLNVHGVEVYEQPVKDFFSENNFVSPTVKTNESFIDYNFHNIRISAGDFFKLDTSKKYDLIYDRASLVALPSEMRKEYAGVIKNSVKSGSRYFLVSYEYDQTQMDGPPFSVTDEEVHSLYKDAFKIERMESLRPQTAPGSRFAALESLKENVYFLTKI
jgi:thiopurine S-methyltransferase